MMINITNQETIKAEHNEKLHEITIKGTETPLR